MVNGQSGRVQGERPYSAWKIAIAVILALIALAAIVFLADQGGYVQIGGPGGVPAEIGVDGGYVLQGY